MIKQRYLPLFGGGLLAASISVLPMTMTLSLPQNAQPTIASSQELEVKLKSIEQLLTQIKSQYQAGDITGTNRDLLTKSLRDLKKQALIAKDSNILAHLALLETRAGIEFGSINEGQFKTDLKDNKMIISTKPNLELEANCLHGLISAKTNQSAQAQQYFAQAFLLAQKSGIRGFEILADYLEFASTFGLVERSRSQHLAIYKNSLAYVEKIYPKRKDLQAKLALSQANSLRYIDPKAALNWADKACILSALCTGTTKSILLGKSYLLQGELYANSGKNSEAISSANKALSQTLSNRQKDVLYQYLAEAYANTGLVDKAIDIKQKQLQIWRAHPGDYKLNLINALANQVGFSASRGDQALAITYMQEWHKLAQEQNKSDRSTALRLADMYISAKRWGEAIPLLEQCLQASKVNAKSYGAGYRDYHSAELLTKLGICNSMSGKVALAKAQMDIAKDIYADNLPTEFIASYIDCLKKAGFTSEATVYQHKLDLIRKRDLEACVACGRG